MFAYFLSFYLSKSFLSSVAVGWSGKGQFRISLCLPRVVRGFVCCLSGSNFLPFHNNATDPEIHYRTILFSIYTGLYSFAQRLWKEEGTRPGTLLFSSANFSDRLAISLAYFYRFAVQSE